MGFVVVTEAGMGTREWRFPNADRWRMTNGGNVKIIGTDNKTIAYFNGDKYITVMSMKRYEKMQS